MFTHFHVSDTLDFRSDAHNAISGLLWGANSETGSVGPACLQPCQTLSDKPRQTRSGQATK